MSKDFAQFDPANATAKDSKTTGFGDLALADLKDLAERYPNEADQQAYLVLRDKNKGPREQAFPLSTWANLYELHRLGQTNYVAEGFRGSFNRSKVSEVSKAPVQDLTKDELKDQPGLKTGQTQDLREGEGGGEASVPYDQWDKADLQAKYEEVTGKKAGRTAKEKLIQGIEKAEKK
jgi:hypothetical protein